MQLNGSFRADFGAKTTVGGIISHNRTHLV